MVLSHWGQVMNFGLQRSQVGLQTRPQLMGPPPSFA